MSAATCAYDGCWNAPVVMVLLDRKEPIGFACSREHLVGFMWATRHLGARRLVTAYNSAAATPAVPTDSDAHRAADASASGGES